MLVHFTGGVEKGFLGFCGTIIVLCDFFLNHISDVSSFYWGVEKVSFFVFAVMLLGKKNISRKVAESQSFCFDFLTLRLCDFARFLNIIKCKKEQKIVRFLLLFLCLKTTPFLSSQ
jgi:hypothetical protein